MKNAQVKYIVENLLHDKCNEPTPLLSNEKIVLVKSNILFTDIEHYRYKIDISNDIIIRYIVRLFSHDETKIPEHGHYDIYTVNNETCVYEYLTDMNGNLLFDVFDFDKICEFVIHDIFAKGYSGGLY